MSHDVKGHYRNGKWRRPHRRKNPKRRGSGSGPADNQGIKVTVALTAAGAVTASGIAGINILKPSAPSRSHSSTNSTFSVEAQAGFKRAEAALTVSGFKASLAMKFETDCAAHSYGRVHKFFQLNPCKSLARAYLQIGEPDQGLILVAISWVAMPSASLAEKYKELIDTTEAGNITELSRETKLYKNIRYTDGSYMSGLHGAAVWNVQVKPVFPATTDVINKILADSRQ
jgi:hypothetical protein